MSARRAYSVFFDRRILPPGIYSIYPIVYIGINSVKRSVSRSFSFSGSGVNQGGGGPVDIGERRWGKHRVPVAGQAGYAPQEEDRPQPRNRNEVGGEGSLSLPGDRQAVLHGTGGDARHAPRALGGPYGSFPVAGDLPGAGPGARLAVDADRLVPHDPLGRHPTDEPKQPPARAQ